jgi:multisubunit Na+/H+ antiporter MnhB subunit
MSEKAQPKHKLQGVGAVLTGLASIVVLSIGTDVLLSKIGVAPPLGDPMGDKLLIIATCYRTIYAIIGCYLAARLAPSKPMKHALILGGVGLVASTLGAIAMWGKPETTGHEWYPIVLIVLAMPPAWIAGKAREVELSGQMSD